MIRALTLTLAACGLAWGTAAPLAAQSQTRTLSRAAATITPADVQRRIDVIADDSMMGRDTPSRGLELTATYIAAHYQRLGLKPAGDSGTYFQRYPITRRKLAPDSSSITLADGRGGVTVRLNEAARFIFGSVPEAPVEGPAVLLAGPLGSEDVAKIPARDHVLLYVVDQSTPAGDAARNQLGRALLAAGPRAIVMVTNLDTASYAQRMGQQARERTAIELPGTTRPPVLDVHDRAVAAFLSGAGLDLAALRASTQPVIRELTDPAVNLRIDLRDIVVSRQTAPNVVAVLEGSDPKLKHEYVVYSAHMDHIGITPGAADSINNGADDDGSGTVGVMELAEALSQKGARPKRSILFLNVSGEEKGLWGSRYFSEKPTVPLPDVVADLNIDMIGRNWKDTIVAIGKEHSDLGATLTRVNQKHPELDMAAIDDRWPEERFYFRSDHYNFARKGVPVLFFFNGVHEDYHQPSDSPDKIDAEKESRILKLLFWLGQDVANATERPKWNPESYKEIVEPARPTS